MLVLTRLAAARVSPGWHGTYPGIGKFTGLSFGEHQLSDVEPRVKRVIDVDSMPVEPFSHDLKTLYEPLRKTFMEDHKDECNVLFRLRVRGHPDDMLWWKRRGVVEL